MKAYKSIYKAKYQIVHILIIFTSSAALHRTFLILDEY